MASKPSVPRFRLEPTQLYWNQFPSYNTQLIFHLKILQVGGIFLIFLWIFVDQLYIQMGVKKRVVLPGSAPGSTHLQRKNSASVMVIDHSSYSTSYATLPRPGKVMGVGDLERRQFATPSTPSRRGHQRRPNRPVMRTKSMSTSQL